DETTRLTALPPDTGVFATGAWPMTTPIGTVVLDCGVTVPTTRLTAPRRPATAYCGCPTTFGTLTPDETTRLTGLPEGTSVPASGSWEMTEPTGTDVLDTLVTVPSDRPPWTNAAVADAWVSTTPVG